jgi:hypothetical protein
VAEGLGQIELDSRAPDGLIADQPPEKQETKALYATDRAGTTDSALGPPAQSGWDWQLPVFLILC